MHKKYFPVGLCIIFDYGILKSCLYHLIACQILSEPTVGYCLLKGRNFAHLLDTSYMVLYMMYKCILVVNFQEN